MEKKGLGYLQYDLKKFSVQCTLDAEIGKDFYGMLPCGAGGKVMPPRFSSEANLNEKGAQPKP